MSALTETTWSPTLVGFPSHLTPSATFRPSHCNPSPKLERHLKKLIWNSLMMPIRSKLPSLSSNGLSTHQNWCTEKPSLANTPKWLMLNTKPKQTQTATTRPSPWHWLTRVVRTLSKTRLTSELSSPLFSLALFSLAPSCSLFGGSSSSHLLQLMNTALTMLVEPRLKQAIHLVSSEHQNSPHIVKMSSIHIYSFLPCIFFYARKTYHPLLAIWRHVLFAFYIALLRIKPSHVFQPI